MVKNYQFSIEKANDYYIPDNDEADTPVYTLLAEELKDIFGSYHLIINWANTQTSFEKNDFTEIYDLLILFKELRQEIHSTKDMEELGYDLQNCLEHYFELRKKIKAHNKHRADLDQQLSDFKKERNNKYIKKVCAKDDDCSPILEDNTKIKEKQNEIRKLDEKLNNLNEKSQKILRSLTIKVSEEKAANLNVLSKKIERCVAKIVAKLKSSLSFIYNYSLFQAVSGSETNVPENKTKIVCSV